MARPNKTGLDYFPFDIDFFEDEKIIAISGEFGIKGEITAIKLLCAIYRNGYFILWNDLLKYKLLRNLPGISPELIESIVNRLVLWEFFDKALFDSVKVLTSRGIQKRYFEASKRRKIAGNLPYLLIEEVCGCVGTESHSSADRIKDARSNASGCGVNVNNNSSSGDEETSSTDGENSANSINVCNKVVNVCNNPITDDINANKNPLKESKGKEIKKDINFSSFGKEECNSEPESPPSPPAEPAPDKIPYQEIVDMFNSICTGYPRVVKLSDSRKNKIRIRVEEMGGFARAKPMIQTIFEKMQASKFLRGDGKSGWKAYFDWVFVNDKNWVKILEGNYDNKISDNEPNTGATGTMGAIPYARQVAGDKTASREAVGQFARAVLEQYKSKTGD